MRIHLILIFTFISANQVFAADQPFMGVHTIDRIQGAEILQQFGIVFIQADGIGRQTDTSHRKYADNSTNDCVSSLVDSTLKKGGNAVVGVNFAYSKSFESGWDSYAIICSGTAVLARKTK